MTPTLPTVSHVHGSWSTRDFRRVLVLRWQENGTTDTQVETLTAGAVAAVLAWKEQTHVVTSKERAELVAEAFLRRGDAYFLSPAGQNDAIDVIATAIGDALVADRQERGDVATTVNQAGQAVEVLTPAQTARAIVADWASTHRSHYVDDNGFGTAPDTGQASLDDLESRIAAALATEVS